ncbi:MAG TPA: TatD family hydrolase [Kofleriaceae bacterium]|jgi:predicted metal-dependent TIM-barrel fold hydrolase|nr:TatD family hydrolase [Kofleriaceae bacterium]
MRIFEPHAHMISRITDDYEHMALAGVEAVLEPAFWLGQPRTHVGTFLDYFDTLLGWERYRAAQYGIHHFCAIALNPKEANDERVNAGVMEHLPRYLEKDGVLAVGEIGFDDMTATEERFFAAQLELARVHGLPALIHTPHRDKKKGVERTLDVLRDVGFPMERALVDHNNEETVALCAGTGCFIGFSIYPDTKMDEGRMVAILQRWGTDKMILNSACDWGKSDPLKVARTAARMKRGGFSAAEVDKVVWHNPIAFVAQSGRLDAAELDRRPVLDGELWQGNSILRGQGA